MNRSRILAGLAASFGFSVAVACGSSSSNNGGGNDAGSTGMSSSSSGSSGAGSGDDAGGTGCASGQALCLGLLGNSCVTPGQMCAGTMVLANECSATSACPSGQVCCSGYVGADGGAILLSDAGASGDAGTGASPFNLSSLGTVAVQCMTQCPSNSLTSQVCVLEDDGGSPTACPEGTTCRDYFVTAISSMLPNTLCLAPLPTYDGGTAAPPGADGGAGGGTSDAAASTTVTVTDAAPE